MDKNKIQEFQKLLAAIEEQTILFNSGSWPRFQQVCVEWGDKVAPFLNTEYKNKFNRELDTIRAVIHEPFLPSDISGVPTENAFNKMKGIAKQRLQELENDLTKISNPSASQSNDEHNWQNKILIYIAVGVVIVILGAFVLYLIKKHLGITI